jgi:hypothetical protein
LRAQEPSSTPLGKLTECRVADLESSLGRRATGRVLYGTLCARATKLCSVMSVLADEEDADAAVVVALYNVAAAALPHWRKCFPKGMRLGIKEPFLKRMADGTVNIRVDHPTDLVFDIARVCAWDGCRIAKRADESENKKCAGCRKVSYCCRECQLLDWKNGGHKEKCTSSPHR